MSSRSAARALNTRRPPARGYARAVQGRRDLDAWIVTVLTTIATMIALYDLLLLGTSIYR